jgi:hypothetical protein
MTAAFLKCLALFRLVADHEDLGPCITGVGPDNKQVHMRLARRSCIKWIEAIIGEDRLVPYLGELRIIDMYAKMCLFGSNGCRQEH